MALTIAGPAIEIFILWLSRWKALRVRFKKHDKWISGLKLAIGLSAGLALVKFTLLSRQDEQNSATEISTLNKKAETENQQLIKQGETLSGQNDQLLATQTKINQQAKDADIAVGSLKADAAKADRRASIQALIDRMDSDDALAYDQLIAMKFDSKAEKEWVQRAVEAMIDHHNDPTYNGSNFNYFRGYFPAETNEMPERLTNRDPFFREETLRELAKDPIQVNLLPRIVDLAVDDPSLGVRTVAIKLLDIWGTQRFLPFRFDVRKWRDQSPSLKLPPGVKSIRELLRTNELDHHPEGQSVNTDHSRPIFKFHHNPRRGTASAVP